MRITIFTAAFLLFITCNAFAEYHRYSDPYSSDKVIAPVQIKDKGLYNLVVG